MNRMAKMRRGQGKIVIKDGYYGNKALRNDLPEGSRAREELHIPLDVHNPRAWYIELPALPGEAPLLSSRGGGLVLTG